MNEGMSPDQIERVFGSLSRIEQKIDDGRATLAQHVADDKTIQHALFERVEALQASANRQKGVMSTLAAVGTALGAGLGWLIERITLGHH